MFVLPSNARLWNDPMVHGQVNDQNPVVETKFTARKLTFFIFLEESVCSGYSLEAIL